MSSKIPIDNAVLRNAEVAQMCESNPRCHGKTSISSSPICPNTSREITFMLVFCHYQSCPLLVEVTRSDVVWHILWLWKDIDGLYPYADLAYSALFVKIDPLLMLQWAFPPLRHFLVTNWHPKLHYQILFWLNVSGPLLKALRPNKLVYNPVLSQRRANCAFIPFNYLTSVSFSIARCDDVKFLL